MIQVIILLLGGLTIWLLASKNLQGWGFLVGLISEPFWIWSAWKHEQWGIVMLAAWYAILYGIGIKNNWRKK
jgi:hypothetical protein